MYTPNTGVKQDRRAASSSHAKKQVSSPPDQLALYRCTFVREIAGSNPVFVISSTNG